MIRGINPQVTVENKKGEKFFIEQLTIKSDPLCRSCPTKYVYKFYSSNIDIEDDRVNNLIDKQISSTDFITKMYF